MHYASYFLIVWDFINYASAMEYRSGRTRLGCG